MIRDINKYIIEGKRLRENLVNGEDVESEHEENQSLSSDEDSNQEIENLSSSSEVSSLADSMSTSAIVNRNLQSYINSMMVDFKDYPEQSSEYKFIQQCYAN